ncbi:hypothetical protein CALCODRAFT_59439 [Calocera cornea HHB12733]|uniref:Uncharacterized protein n=1 Tax=Calocera cornea HHB12733 TaxID=1353952 RepID=A0A165IXC0_9BASI|nr:hypothetical protein CALCODRAFT_59439 [Calocera cornea HHB12733]
MHYGNKDTWAVADRAQVNPVWTIDDDACTSLRSGVLDKEADSYCAVIDDIHAGQEIVGRYTFDMKGTFQPRRALLHARKQIIKEAERMGCNVLIREGWSVTVLRRGDKDLRIEVVYRARPAQSEGIRSAKEPPFLNYLPPK